MPSSEDDELCFMGACASVVEHFHLLQARVRAVPATFIAEQSSCAATELTQLFKICPSYY